MQIGSLVKCKKGKQRQIYDRYGNIINHAQPIVGGLYVVRGIIDPTGILLEEIVNSSVMWGDGTTSEPGFLNTRFEEVQSLFESEQIMQTINQVLI